jgi:hypothetical protein
MSYFFVSAVAALFFFAAGAFAAFSLVAAIECAPKQSRMLGTVGIAVFVAAVFIELVR